MLCGGVVVLGKALRLKVVVRAHLRGSSLHGQIYRTFYIYNNIYLVAGRRPSGLHFAHKTDDIYRHNGCPAAVNLSGPVPDTVFDISYYSRDSWLL